MWRSLHNSPEAFQASVLPCWFFQLVSCTGSTASRNRWQESRICCWTIYSCGWSFDRGDVGDSHRWWTAARASSRVGFGPLQGERALIVFICESVCLPFHLYFDQAWRCVCHFIYMLLIYGDGDRGCAVHPPQFHCHRGCCRLLGHIASWKKSLSEKMQHFRGCLWCCFGQCHRTVQCRFAISCIMHSSLALKPSEIESTEDSISQRAGRPCGTCTLPHQHQIIWGSLRPGHLCFLSTFSKQSEHVEFFIFESFIADVIQGVGHGFARVQVHKRCGTLHNWRITSRRNSGQDSRCRVDHTFDQCWSLSRSMAHLCCGGNLREQTPKWNSCPLWNAFDRDGDATPTAADRFRCPAHNHGRALCRFPVCFEAPIQCAHHRIHRLGDDGCAAELRMEGNGPFANATSPSSNQLWPQRRPEGMVLRWEEDHSQYFLPCMLGNSRRGG